MNSFVALWLVIAAMFVVFGVAMEFIYRNRERDRDPILYLPKPEPDRPAQAPGTYIPGPPPDYELEQRASRLSSDIWLRNWRNRPAQRAWANRPWNVE